MSRPSDIPARHEECSDYQRCQAVRCTNGCGQFEHTKPYELDPECLRHDLQVGYTERANCGKGLIHQIRNALAQPSGVNDTRDNESSTGNKPGSRPPGWNADASALLTDINRRWTEADQATLADWRRQARTILGFATPSIGLPNVDCFVCGQPTLRVARDASSDVWCSSPRCHDSDRFWECAWIDEHLNYDPELGYGTPGTEHWECRHTDRSLTHSVRFPRHSWVPIFERMRAAKELIGA